jgi:hypothetical protein
MHELLESTPSISFAVTDHSELLRHVYKFESEKLLNPPNLLFIKEKYTLTKFLFRNVPLNTVCRYLFNSNVSVLDQDGFIPNFYLSNRCNFM